jgi:hypothetical protein
MRVRCERLLSPTTGQPLDRSPLITIGQEYLVLSVIAQPGNRILIRLIDDRGESPSVWDVQMFTTTSTRIPYVWESRVDQHGNLTLAPAAWQRLGFWEEYFDGDARAVEEFRAGLEAIRAEPD